MAHQQHTPETCNASIAAVKDALYVLNGKWKLLIVIALSEGPRRFTELQHLINGITPRVLSKELRELELNDFVERKVYETIPVKVSYELTPYSESLDGIIEALREWGVQHKNHIIERRKQQPPAAV